MNVTGNQQQVNSESLLSNLNVPTNRSDISTRNHATKHTATSTSNQETEFGQPPIHCNEKLLQPSSVRISTDNTATDTSNTYLHANPNEIPLQNTSIVQALMQTVIPQPMVSIPTLLFASTYI